MSYNVAFNVVQIPLGVIGLPLGIVLLPTLSRALAEGRGGGLRADRRAVAAAAPLGDAVRDGRGHRHAGPGHRALFGWGFDAEALAATATTLGVFLLGLPAHALNVMLARAFYSARDTATPVAVAIASVGVNVVVSLATVERLGLAGLALGIAVGAWFEALVLTLLLHRRRVALDAPAVVRAGGAALVGSLIAAVAAFVTLVAIDAVAPSQPIGHGIVGSIVRVVVAGAASGLAYLVYSRLMRLAELQMTVDVVRAALHRR